MRLRKANDLAKWERAGHPPFVFELRKTYKRLRDKGAFGVDKASLS
jgi:hypothetical protein